MPDSGSSFTHTVLALHKPSSLPSLALPPSNMQVRNGDLGYTGSSAEAFVTDLSARKRFLRLEVKLAAGMRLFKANASEIFIGKQYLQRGDRVLGAPLVTGAAISSAAWRMRCFTSGRETAL